MVLSHTYKKQHQHIESPSMAEESVTLHSSWASPYAYRVIWALKLKGIKFEQIEEDMANKSEALLKHNPVHKKVPVLVHNGKAVAESAVILNYIEEAWPDRTPLLPGDPHARAMARFWIDFGLQKSPIFSAFFLSSENDREEKAKTMVETLRIIQDEALGDNKFFGGDTIGVVDLFYGWIVQWLEPMEHVVGIRILESSTLPRLLRWAVEFRQEPVIEENLPDGAALLKHFQMLKTRFASAEST